MSLKLLIDEDSQAKKLVKLLKQASHNVVIVNDIGLTGKPDSLVLDFARQEDRIVLTHNCYDFELLHQENPSHPGILAVYRDKNSSKNMNFKEIVKAISNLESSLIPLRNQFITLNYWNY